MPSRPKASDRKIIDRAKQASKLGLKYELTAKYCGLSESTFYKWVSLGKVDADGNCKSEEHREFAAAVAGGESDGAAALLARIIKASDKSWQAAAWLLERRHNYSIAAAAEVSRHDEESVTDATSAIELLASTLSIEVLEAAIAKKRKP